MSDIIETLTNNSSKAQKIIEALPDFLKSEKDLRKDAIMLDNAIITTPEKEIKNNGKVRFLLKG